MYFVNVRGWCISCYLIRCSGITEEGVDVVRELWEVFRFNTWRDVPDLRYGREANWVYINITVLICNPDGPMGKQQSVRSINSNITVHITYGMAAHADSSKRHKASQALQSQNPTKWVIAIFSTMPTPKCLASLLSSSVWWAKGGNLNSSVKSR